MFFFHLFVKAYFILCLVIRFNNVRTSIELSMNVTYDFASSSDVRERIADERMVMKGKKERKMESEKERKRESEKER